MSIRRRRQSCGGSGKPPELHVQRSRLGPSVARFIATRLVESIPVLLLSSLVAFSILHLIPGDPIDAMLGAAAAGISTPESQAALVAQIREQLGLNDALPIQYLRWLADAVRLDFGVRPCWRCWDASTSPPRGRRDSRTGSSSYGTPSATRSFPS